MSTLQQIEELLPRMTRAERADLWKRLAREFGTDVPGVTFVPGVCGGNPCVAGTRIPVWLLEAMRRDGATERQFQAAYPQLTSTDLQAAWEYVRRHPAEVDQQIRENQPDESGEA
ncbi:MAG: DUF433 domain-containing protein [Planctomycetota bacterium]|nr:DUF433 domain-containing protein [Planctomycetota bacterium]